ncbi:MAG: glucose/galactose MFS transporter [Bacteroidetes bacterium HGW-Bacteroidetes-22]|nr:MAG: glucose/galactose MFS transporter [Bacteroidetes bacterium HGW-Bacteroidetes-22]
MKNTPAQSSRNSFLPMLIIGILFFIFGFVTWLNGILIPYFKIACELSNFEATFVAFAFYISYTLMALPSAWILKKTGFKNGMMVGLWVMAAGTLIFVPAALSRTYSIFLTGLFVMGAGLTVLQTASNPYITILGPAESAARRISIMGIFNKLAGAAAPLIMAYFILHDGDSFVTGLANMGDQEKALALDGLARRVIAPYVVMSVVLFVLGLGVRFSPLPEVEADEESVESHDNTEHHSIFAFPQLILGVLTLFLYVGAEVIAGDTIIRYGQSLGIALETAKAFTTYTLIAMVAGYIVGIIFIPKYISQHKALLISAILGIIFTTFAVFTSGMVSVLFIALLGLANALVWPAIWPLAIAGLGKFIKTGSALLIMAIAGGAILPLAWGKLADVWTNTHAYAVLLPCYLVILLYAWKWHKLRKW